MNLVHVTIREGDKHHLAIQGRVDPHGDDP